LQYAKRNELEIILSADANAHSPLWGGELLDKRGILLEDMSSNY
jgi:hypothetical protein